MWAIERKKNQIILQAGILTRIIRIDGKNEKISFHSKTYVEESLIEESKEPLLFRISLASPNARPKGIKLVDNSQIIDNTATVHKNTDTLDVKNTKTIPLQQTEWIRSLTEKEIDFENFEIEIEKERLLVKLTFSQPKSEHDFITGLSIEHYYQMYDSYPVIRKWIKIKNSVNN